MSVYGSSFKKHEETRSIHSKWKLHSMWSNCILLWWDQVILHSTVKDMLGILLQQSEYSKGKKQKWKDLHMNGSVWTCDQGGNAL